jgi:Ca2+-binding RTX toxin-like protein
MATMNGTAAADNLVGTTSDDILNGLGGNDTLNGGGGNDQIFGDVSVPYFTYNGKFYLLSNAGTWKEAQAQAVSLGGNLVTVNDAAENQFLVNTFGGTEQLWIGLTDEVVEGQFKWVNGEAVTYTNWLINQPDNFGGNEDYVHLSGGTGGQWNDNTSSIIYRGIIEIANPSNDTIIGSTGNDTIDGGIGQDTADYSTIGQAITLKPTGVVTKGTAGIDQLIGIEKIIGATGQVNIIDASTATGTATINANLATQSLIVNTGVAIPSTLSFTVTNFVNVIGAANNDTITGDNGNNNLMGNGGNDTIIGSAGDDTINGGLGSDTVNYSSLTEAITLLASGIVNKGSFGTDKIVDIETVIGATGQSNSIDASTGIATTTSLNVNLATNSLIINGLPAPINSLTFNVQNFVNVVGTTQNDIIKGNNLANELVGNTGNDTIQGNDGDDILDGGDGNDQLFGGNNDDQLFGGIGNDILQGDNGNDLLNGDLGNDTLKGLAGDDILDGGLGSDSLLGGIGNDILIGDLGDDILYAEAGDDLVFGDDGNDRLYGGDGFDELNGGIGKDFLYGGNNNDTLFGNNDNDTLYGEAGDDILNGGQGSDVLRGGLNNDIFVIAVGNGSDIVQDFQDGFDKMGLSGGLLFSQLTILGSGTNTLIKNTSSGETFATLQNVSSTLITNLDFLVI